MKNAAQKLWEKRVRKIWEAALRTPSQWRRRKRCFRGLSSVSPAACEDHGQDWMMLKPTSKLVSGINCSLWRGVHRALWPREHPCWNRAFLINSTSWKGPMLAQLLRKDRHRSSLWRTASCGRHSTVKQGGKACGRKNRKDCYKLTRAPFPHTTVPLHLGVFRK